MNLPDSAPENHSHRVRPAGDSRISYENDFIRLRTDPVRFADGTLGEYSYIDDDQAAVTSVPLDKRRGKRNVLLLRQDRYPTRSSSWEVPAGKIEKGEMPLEAAQRELAEEAAVKAELWHQLPTQLEYPGRSNARSDIFIASGISEGSLHPDSTEVITDRKWFSMDDVEDMMLDGDINIGHTMASIGVANAFLNRNPNHPISKRTG